ncbi:hypothetical protein CDAR_395831 [Caerostris darwini]|uniref:Uncharacterized protein n=1 Tax=Caerostris darwini TaxID=1538125 RepID=A0AAV4QPG3_9ARAC|nr:hypothetical protein CDAR_395831 [Caerostris darwini]
MLACETSFQIPGTDNSLSRPNQVKPMDRYSGYHRYPEKVPQGNQEMGVHFRRSEQSVNEIARVKPWALTTALIHV